MTRELVQPIRTDFAVADWSSVDTIIGGLPIAYVREGAVEMEGLAAEEVGKKYGVRCVSDLGSVSSSSVTTASTKRHQWEQVYARDCVSERIFAFSHKDSETTHAPCPPVPLQSHAQLDVMIDTFKQVALPWPGQIWDVPCAAAV
jgi:hypothetical protein